MKYPLYIEKEMLRKEDESTIEKKVKALLGAMTMEEKMNLLHGARVPQEDHVANAGWIPGVPRLGVPEIRMFDGPAGVTSVYETTGLPIQEILGATWDTSLAYKFGKVEGSENFAISGNTQLGSQFDLVRNPQFERSKDMLGEDPFLVSEMAVEETKGIQDQYVSATLKHFGMGEIAIDSQNAPDQIMDEQSMHELYLPAFEAAIKRGGASSVMSSYNKFNGSYASANTYSQQTVLRDMWNYKGYVMCDWGVNHGLTVHKGNDVEMPYGAYNSNERMLLNIEKGRISEEDVEKAAEHVLYGMGMVGYLSLVELDADGNVVEEADRVVPIKMRDNYTNAVKDGLLKENADICHEIARKGITLLKNEKEALPLKEKDYTGSNKVAFIGLSANHHVSGINQERSYGVISEMTSPYEATIALAGANANIYSETGIDLIGEKIPENCLWQDEACTKPGVIRTYGITPEDAKGVSMQEMLLEYILEQMKANQGGAPDMPASVGGAGKEFKGVASSEDLDDPVPIEIPWQNTLAGDIEGVETGTVCCIDKDIDFNCGTIGTDTNRSYKNSGNGTAFAQGNVYTWKGFIKVEETGDYDILLNAIGGNCAFKMKMGDRFIPVGYVELRENAQWAWGNIIPTAEGMEIQGAKLHLEADKAYEFMICGNATIKEKDLQIRLSWITPKMRKESYEAAIKLAEEADKVVFFLTDDYEVKAPVLEPKIFGPKEEPWMNIPEEQKHFLNDVRSVMKPYAEMILVNNHSKMYALGDIEPKCDAIVEMASPGQEGGKALAEILLGKINPSGKVVVSYPCNNEDTLVSDTPEHVEKRHMGYMVEGKQYIDFDEGIFVGYRWYDKENVKPLFPFGHGLSYTSFSYDDIEVNGNKISFTVTNTGHVIGSEIAQVYLGEGQVPEHIMMAKKQLCGFARLEDIAPGESRNVEIEIPERSFCYWDPKSELIVRKDGTKDKWVKTAGSRKVYVGTSSEKLILEGIIEVY